MSTPSHTARCRHCDRLAAPWIEIQGQVRRVVLWCSSCNRAALAGVQYIDLFDPGRASQGGLEL